MTHWSHDAIVYHLYPLGALGAPEHNDHQAPPSDRIQALSPWLDHVAGLGADTLLLGPIFESSTHGYDTSDYYHLDRRLGRNEDFTCWSRNLHARGLRLILDGVFHHVGRDFWAFRDVLTHGQASAYCDWFHLDFQQRSPHGDPFHYHGWNGHYDLVKLNVHHPAVKAHLFDAVRYWIETFHIDGLRLDAADVLDLDFQRELTAFCRALRPDFWMLGEVIHGDYRRWTANSALDSVTNYEVYKGLYSSCNDRNLFELAYSLNRQFGPDGIYRHFPLYSFVDNHDVDRIASRLQDPAHLYPLYALLFTIPGVPSLYYGSELGVTGRKGHGTDAPLRPPLDPSQAPSWGSESNLLPVIQRLIALRRENAALRHGAHLPLRVSHEQLVFAREAAAERVVVAVNLAGTSQSVGIQLPWAQGGRLHDLLNPGQSFDVERGHVTLPLDACWARVLGWAPSA